MSARTGTLDFATPFTISGDSAGLNNPINGDLADVMIALGLTTLEEHRRWCSMVREV
jgi:hypothetical protein